MPRLTLGEVVESKKRLPGQDLRSLDLKRGLWTCYNGARVYSDASIIRGITQKTFSLGAKIVTGGQNVAYAYPNQICTAGSASPIGGGQNQRSLL